MPKKPQFGSIYQRGSRWWIKYFRDGKPFWESSGSTKQSDAQRLLDKRRAEIYAGTHIEGPARRILVSEFLEGLVRDYKINGKAEDWCESVVRVHLKPFFGEMRAAKVRPDDAEKFIEQRQSEGASNSTINKEIALLRRSFNLAKRSGKLSVVPLFPAKLAEKNVRKGFFERDEFIKHRDALPQHLKPVTTFAYWTGCRKGEILGLTWSHVDLRQRVVRLEPGETKNDESRMIPLAGELLEMLRMQKDIRDEKWAGCQWVFFRSGKKIVDFRGAWEKACEAADLINSEGKPTKLFHDLRRTGVRNLIRAGVPERVAMAISGHKTRSVFDRYNIVSERDLHEAARRLSNYIANSENQVDSDNVVTMALESAKSSRGESAPKLLN
jgi:integrase